MAALQPSDQNDDLTGVSTQVISPLSSPHRHLKRSQLECRMSVGSLREINVSLSDLQQFHNEQEQCCQSFIDNDCPRSALLDEVDKELLSGLDLSSQGVEKVARKVGRPKGIKKQVAQSSLASYLLRSHVKPV